MIGAIIGDIVGSQYEFNNINTLDFELFTDKCDFTDDTICTIAVADAIMNSKSYKESLLQWCKKYPHPTGAYGASFARWIHSDDPQPYGSYGNGSAMRVSAVGWLFDDLELVIENADESAAVSHNHPEGLKGARCIAVLIYLLRTNQIRKEHVKQVAKEKFGYDIPEIEDLLQNNHFNETCQVTIPQSIACFLAGDDFESCIRYAIAIGGDSDTIGAITGSLAEAVYTIPAEIEQKALSYLDKDLLQIVNEFKEEINHL